MGMWYLLILQLTRERIILSGEGGMKFSHSTVEVVKKRESALSLFFFFFFFFFFFSLLTVLVLDSQ